MLHSHLTSAERGGHWRRIARGEVQVVVGARSGVFAPTRNLGLIVIDEEHETSFKQDATPRYHARDVAVMRARLEGIPILLGSATPALESWHNAQRGQYQLLRLPKRVADLPMPQVSLIDMRHDLPRGGRFHALSAGLESAMRHALGSGGQVILLLNRRGFATFVQCPACGNVPGCPHCAIALTVHQTPPVMRCHYCGHEDRIPNTCLVCGHETQRLRGLGTQQLEHFLGLRYPRARIARMDLDTTSSKWAHHHILERVASGEVDILLGTQMIAKGLDFPNVTVVGVVDADTGLHFPDFRAGERTFQLVAQVAGRAGRGARGGRVFVQTRAPDHHAIRAAAAHSVSQFAAAELPLRSPPNPPYPPRTGLVRFVIATDDHARTAELAERVATWLRRAGERLGGALTVLGPAPCPLMRLKGKWRWHVLAKSAEPRVLGPQRRGIPQGHHGVADELVDGAAAGTDRLRHRLHVQAERSRQLVGRDVLGKRSESLQIGEEDGQLPHLSAERRLAVLRVQLAHQIERRVLAHATQRGLRLLQTREHGVDVAKRRLHR